MEMYAQRVWLYNLVENFVWMQQEYKQDDAETILLQRARKDVLKKLYLEADINPLDTAYRMVMSQLKEQKSSLLTCPRMLNGTVEPFFSRSRRPTMMTTITKALETTKVPFVSLDRIAY